MRIHTLSEPLMRTLIAAMPKGVPNFRLNDPAPNTPVAQPNAATLTAATSVQMLVAMAAIDPAMERRRKLAQQADRGVDALEKLHRELLAGVASPEKIADIVEWSETLETPQDPVLAAILDEIKLRVRVEQAKHDVRV